MDDEKEAQTIMDTVMAQDAEVKKVKTQDEGTREDFALGKKTK